jgi:CheY-like chemotaxis protein
VPIIAVTAHAMSTDRARCLEVGMDGYITKPIDVAQVQATVTEYVRTAPHESV